MLEYDTSSESSTLPSKLFEETRTKSKDSQKIMSILLEKKDNKSNQKTKN